MQEEDSGDKEYLLTSDLDDPGWSEEPVLDSHEYLCINEIPRLATPPLQPNQGVLATPPLLLEHIEMSLDHELMELYIPEDIPDLLDVSEEVISDFDTWAQNVLHYPW